jgi:hypothetical protein
MTIISFRKADLVVHNSLMSVCRVPGFVSGVACKDIAAQGERDDDDEEGVCVLLRYDSRKLTAMEKSTKSGN